MLTDNRRHFFRQISVKIRLETRFIGTLPPPYGRLDSVCPHGGATKLNHFPLPSIFGRARRVSGSIRPSALFSSSLPPLASPCCRLKSGGQFSEFTVGKKLFLSLSDSLNSGKMSSVSYHISNLLEKMTSTDKDFR